MCPRGSAPSGHRGLLNRFASEVNVSSSPGRWEAERRAIEATIVKNFTSGLKVVR